MNTLPTIYLIFSVFPVCTMFSGFQFPLVSRAVLLYLLLGGHSGGQNGIWL